MFQQIQNETIMGGTFCRRIRRWIAEKQREKNGFLSHRRYRHKSLGDVESVSKTNGRPVLSQSFQVLR